MSGLQSESIEKAFRRDEKMLVRWLTKKLGDSDTAQDVAQSVYLRVWAFSKKSHIENPRALIFKTASNLAINELKRGNRFRARHVSPPADFDGDMLDGLASPEPSPEVQTSLKQDVSKTLKAIDALPTRPRRAFIMNRFDGLSYREIAKKLGVSESSIEKYMIEALKLLRSTLSDQTSNSSTIVPFKKAAIVRKTVRSKGS